MSGLVLFQGLHFHFTPSKQHRIHDSFEGQCSDDEEVSSPSPAIHNCLSLQSELTKMLNIPHLPPPQNSLDEIEKYGILQGLMHLLVLFLQYVEDMFKTRACLLSQLRTPMCTYR